MSPGNPHGFPVGECLREQGSEFVVPLAEGLVTDGDTAPVQQLLDVSLAEGVAVVQPQGVADNSKT